MTRYEVVEGDKQRAELLAECATSLVQSLYYILSTRFEGV